mmetsp:Transcript_2125/g.4230  ORF Transcript_2125/g.4230 Transcript_2125/m.4230 type:complete len:574 (-) Transcript_2125:98-1819(-)
MSKGTLVWACLACAAYGMRVQTSYRRSDNVPATANSQAHVPEDAEDSATLARLLLALNSQAAFNPSGPNVFSAIRSPKYAPRAHVGIDTELDVLGDARRGQWDLDLTPSEVTIRGPESQIRIAEQLVMDFAERRPPQFQATVECPKDKLKFMLGPFNRHIKFIREVTGAVIEIEGDRTPGNEPCTVSILGSPAWTVQRAEELLKSFMDGDQLVVLDFDCPRDFLGRVIGPNGRNMKQIEKQTSCFLEVKLDRKLPAYVPARVVAKGLASQIDACRDAVQNAITKGDEYFEKKIMEIRRDHIGLVMGGNNRNLKRIREETNCVVYVSDIAWDLPNDVPAKVHFQGAVSEVEAAEQMVRDILAVADTENEEPAELTFECPNNRLEPLLGPGARTISDLRKSLGVHIKIMLENDEKFADLDPDGMTTVLIRGRKDRVPEAAKALRQFIAKGISEIIMEVPKAELGRLVGPDAGLYISFLRSATSCFIETVCEGDWDPDLCKVVIKGPTDKVEAAQKRVQKFIETATEDLAEKVIRIPKRSVSNVIGPSGLHVRRIADWSNCFVRVDAKREAPVEAR